MIEVAPRCPFCGVRPPALPFQTRGCGVIVLCEPCHAAATAKVAAAGAKP